MIDRPAHLTFALLVAVPMRVWAADGTVVFSEHCALCHGEIGRFVERRLSLTENIPVLRNGGEKLEVFLTHHGRLRTDEIEALCKRLSEELARLHVR